MKNGRRLDIGSFVNEGCPVGSGLRGSVPRPCNRLSTLLASKVATHKKSAANSQKPFNEPPR